MPQRTLKIVGCEAFRWGTAKTGRPWTMYKIDAVNANGLIKEELISFDELPLGVADYEVERREREYRGQTYVSFTLKAVKGSEPKIKKPMVPAGRYAVNAHGEWELYRVWVGSQYDPPPIHVYSVRGVEKGERCDQQEELAVLTEIAKDPGKAALEFGHRTGSCSRCGKELDVNLSRKLGVGPTCMKHWFDNETAKGMKKEARTELRADGLDPNEKYDKIEVTA